MSQKIGQDKVIEIIKKECYVFDFAPNRALRLITDYSCRLDIDDDNPETFYCKM